MTQPRFFVAGGAGFIGSHLVERLVLRGEVTVYDNLSMGRREYLAGPLRSGRCQLVEGDLLDLERLSSALVGHSHAFHLSANPEARWGLERPRLDLEQGTIATWNLLEACRSHGVSHFVLASSGTVYGNVADPRSENQLGALPISLYGASKLAGEAMLSAYAECFGLRGLILRFGNVVGPRGTHGAALDFLRKLQQDPTELEVLGDGAQSKPYLHVTDCVKGLLFALDRSPWDLAPLQVYNLAPEDVTPVRRIAELCRSASPYPEARIRYTGGSQGWPGDVPRSRLDPGKLAHLGWRVSYSSDRAIEFAVDALAREVFGSSRLDLADSTIPG